MIPDGKLVRPYPVKRCAASDCGQSELGDDAYLFTNAETGKLLVFCGACAETAELHAPLRFRRVML